MAELAGRGRSRHGAKNPKLTGQRRHTTKLIWISKSGKRIGEDHPNAKLSDVQIDEVHEMVESGRSYRDIAAQFNVSFSSIAKIASCERRACLRVRTKRVVIDAD